MDTETAYNTRSMSDTRYWHGTTALLALCVFGCRPEQDTQPLPRVVVTEAPDRWLPGAVPLFALWNADSADNFSTVDPV